MPLHRECISTSSMPQLLAKKKDLFVPTSSSEIRLMIAHQVHFFASWKKTDTPIFHILRCDSGKGLKTPYSVKIQPLNRPFSSMRKKIINKRQPNNYFWCPWKGNLYGSADYHEETTTTLPPILIGSFHRRCTRNVHRTRWGYPAVWRISRGWRLFCRRLFEQPEWNNYHLCSGSGNNFELVLRRVRSRQWRLFGNFRWTILGFHAHWNLLLKWLTNDRYHIHKRFWMFDRSFCFRQLWRVKLRRWNRLRPSLRKTICCCEHEWRSYPRVIVSRWRVDI